MKFLKKLKDYWHTNLISFQRDSSAKSVSALLTLLNKLNKPNNDKPHSRSMQELDFIFDKANKRVNDLMTRRPIMMFALASVVNIVMGIMNFIFFIQDVFSVGKRHF